MKSYESPTILTFTTISDRHNEMCVSWYNTIIIFWILLLYRVSSNSTGGERKSIRKLLSIIWSTFSNAIGKSKTLRPSNNSRSIWLLATSVAVVLSVFGFKVGQQIMITNETHYICFFTINSKTLENAGSILIRRKSLSSCLHR